MFENKKWASALGALALAVIGSATWDFVAKPIFVAIFEGILLLGTLGLTSVREGIYIDIGAQRGEQIGVFSASLITCIFSSAIVAIGFIPFALITRLIREGHSDSETLNDQSLRPIIIKRLKMISLFNLTLSVFVVFIGLFLFARTVYVSEMTARLNRYQYIVSPFINQEQRILYASRVALIQSRADFVSVFLELRRLAVKHGLQDTGNPFVL